MERKSTISSQMRGKIDIVNRPDNRSPASGLYRESPEATSSTGGGATVIKDASQISLTSSRQSGNEKSKQIRHSVQLKEIKRGLLIIVIFNNSDLEKEAREKRNDLISCASLTLFRIQIKWQIKCYSPA